MLKTKMRDMPVVTIHIEYGDKDALIVRAKKQGMQLATFCRMVLLRELKEGEHDKY